MYDLYAGAPIGGGTVTSMPIISAPFSPPESPAENMKHVSCSSPDVYPSAPSLTWGISWRALVVEFGGLVMLGDVLRLPAHTLLYAVAALVPVGALFHVYRRWGVLGAFWRAAAAACALAVASGSQVLLVPCLVVAGTITLGEPMLQRVHVALRRRRLRRDLVAKRKTPPMNCWFRDSGYTGSENFIPEELVTLFRASGPAETPEEH